MRFRSNVSLIAQSNGQKPRVFVDCVPMAGVVSAEYEAEPGDLPILTLQISMPLLGHEKPRVRRKCLTRPHVPSKGTDVERLVRGLEAAIVRYRAVLAPAVS